MQIENDLGGREEDLIDQNEQKDSNMKLISNK